MAENIAKYHGILRPPSYWMTSLGPVRQPAINKARKKNPHVKVPDELLIYERNGELYPYKKTAIDQVLARLGERVGIYFTNHDLRRTCGRMMYRSGVRLEQIAKIFGHSDTRTTIRYLGLDFEDMSETMNAYARYQNTPVVPKMVQNEESQLIGGRSGISTRQTIWTDPVLNSPRSNDPVRALLKK